MESTLLFSPEVDDDRLVADSLERLCQLDLATQSTRELYDLAKGLKLAEYFALDHEQLQEMLIAQQRRIVS